jgi:hypothetical protein
MTSQRAQEGVRMHKQGVGIHHESGRHLLVMVRTNRHGWWVPGAPSPVLTVGQSIVLYQARDVNKF